MHASIENKLNNISYLDHNARRRAIETINALDNGKCFSVEFHADGSGAVFHIWSPTIDHGCPGDAMFGFNMEVATLILAGHRLTSHKLPKCM